MEFPFNVNHLFAEEITIVGNEMKSKHLSDTSYLNKLQIVIELLGKRSARSQQLSGSITTLHKIQLHGHQLYVLKDEKSNNGLGSVVGFIKVGKKQLFVLDNDGNHNEMLPLCVLDFYVHESQQRKGYGLKLFKHMISKNNVQPCQLAIDRPSKKFISFLKKHFGLWANIPQVNNFVIFEGFFKNQKCCTRRSKNENYRNRISYCRPLSRAVSDSIIKRNRMTELSVSEVLHGVRPYSGTNFNNYQNNNRRQKWDRDVSWFQESHKEKLVMPPRTNMYSRFSHQVNSVLPSTLPSKYSSLIAQENVITNGDKITKSPPLQQKIQENLMNTKETTDSHKRNQKMRSPNPIPIQIYQCNEEQPLPQKPYDMIAELKAKDKKAQNQIIPPIKVNHNWQNTQLRGIYSSWNIFGVPNTSNTWTQK